MLPNLYWTLLFIVTAYAFLVGTNEQRVVAAACVLASIASIFVDSIDARFEDVEVGVFMVDVSLLILLIAVALRSNRFWPLWIAGLHLTGVFAHFAKLLRFDLMPAAYAIATQFWSYPIMLILMVAVWRAQQRRGQDPSLELGERPV